jgi:5-methylthioadenosine/S-adenosylhomocysteine deaminase
MAPRLLIRDAMIVTLDAADRVIHAGYVLVEGERIAAVGEGAPPSGLEAERVIDGRDRLVIPGLVNSHLHSYENYTRGRLDNLPHNVWMIFARPPLGGSPLGPDDVYLRTMLGCLEMLRSGVTMAIDDFVHVPATDRDSAEAVMKAYDDAGLRAVVTATTVDRAYHRTLPWAEEVFPAALQAEFDARPRPSVAEALSFARWGIERWGAGRRVRFALSPSAPQRCTRELIEALGALQRETGTPLVVHALETRLQAVAGPLTFGTSMVAYLDEVGLLRPETAVVHAVWADADDVRRLAASGATVFHNPSSNLKLGSGIAPVRALLKAGIRVGIGTDGMGSNDAQNLFEEMRLAGLVGKIVSDRYEDWLSAPEVLRMATRGPLRFAGLDGALGAVEAGRLADLVVLDRATLPFTPLHDPVRQLVYSERGASVRTVVVGGRIVMDDGVIRAVDEGKMLERIRQSAARARETGEAGWRRSQELEPYFAEIYRRAAVAPLETPARVLWGCI